MQILKNGCNVVRRRNAADETGGYINEYKCNIGLLVANSVQTLFSKLFPELMLSSLFCFKSINGKKKKRN